jgi:5-methylcytosine-specific restriction endonuclease McrA
MAPAVKLSQLRPQIGRLPPMLGPAPGDEKDRNRYRADREPWRAWYQTARWKRLRLRVFTRDMFTCRECGCIEMDTSKLVAHHSKPHRGDERKFWDEDGNIVTVCQTCHDGPIKARERNQAA